MTAYTANTANTANAAITANTVATAQGVSKSFSRKTILDGVNIQLAEGRIYGLVGRNGTGKSTLLSLLAGQARYKGKIEVFGQAPFDNAEVMDQVVFAGVDTAYPRSWKFGAIVKVAAKRYPHWQQEVAEHLIEVFSLDLGTRHGSASRGQRSMLAIAIALAARAPLTLLDEPYLGLDAYNLEAFYRELLAELEAHPRTVVLATHDLHATSQVVDSYLVLRDGVVRTLDAALLDDALVEVTVTGVLPAELEEAALAKETVGGNTRVIVERGVAQGKPVNLEDAVKLAMGGLDV